MRERVSYPNGCGFDVVIGNPPYERIQVMQANAPEAAEFLKANYRAAASGNFDIYVCFIERGLQLLNANGFFGYICPNKFFQSEYGQETRQLLSEGRNVSHLVNFGHLQIFSQATIYTCLLFLRRQAQTALAFHKVEDLELWREKGQAAQMQVPIELLTPAEWNFVPGASQPIFEKINGQPRKLEEVADIFVGLQTSADRSVSSWIIWVRPRARIRCNRSRSARNGRLKKICSIRWSAGQMFRLMGRCRSGNSSSFPTKSKATKPS